MIPMARPHADADDIAAVTRVLESGVWAHGPEVQEFEKEFAAYCGVKHAIAVANGTVALHAALLGVGVRSGDTVVTTPFTFIATSNAILHAGAKPEFCDIWRESFCLDPHEVENAVLRSSPAAILVVHLFGHPCCMTAINRIAEHHRIPVIEDCAQAHGATWNGKRAGGLGDVGAFSFYATKNLATGEGGMVTTDNDDVASRVRCVINHGRGTEPYEFVRLGYNYRMSSLHAALGRSQLKKLDANNARRQAIAARYQEEITNPLLIKPVTLPGAGHVFHQYTLRCKHRLALKQWLAKEGVCTGVFYPSLGNEQPMYSDPRTAIPVSRAAGVSWEVLSIPVHPGLSDDEVTQVVKSCNQFQM